MFDLIRQSVDLQEVISKYTDSDVKKVGESTYQLVEDECPLPECGHKDCFKIKDEGEGNAFFKCFSCDNSGDVSRFVALMEGITDREAALKLAKEYKIQIPSDYSPVQEIFNLAAQYYHNTFLECEKEYVELAGLTPIEYQKRVRGHKDESFKEFSIGWSDGGLVDYLESLGFPKDLLLESGLMNKKGFDFLPSKSFIYPHFVRGRVSHFTFKDPLKKNAFQLPNKAKLNQHMFYGQDTISLGDKVAVVEGENDLISVREAGWKAGIICSNGQLSGAQLDWMAERLGDKEVITMYDPDPAGDKYREKTAKLASKFKGLKQIKIAGDKDIDKFIVDGGTLEEALKHETAQSQEVAVEVDKAKSGDDGILVKSGAYYKERWKDGESFLIKLTNFTIQLKNIFIQGERRDREVIFVREDGKRSRPTIVTSEVKVSLKSFKSLVANAVDGTFYGREEDLGVLWDFIYKDNEEKEVHLPTTVGRLSEFKGWIFRDCFISDTGAVIAPDAEGIIWIGGKQSGIKPMSLDVDSNFKNNDKIDIPLLVHDIDGDDRERLISTFVKHLGTNLGDIGSALLMLSWAKANVYSDIIFNRYKSFPFLFFWGRHGKGKTVIAKWILSIFGMEECGYGTIAQYKSGVGFGRKIAYYASLPVIMDEIRADKDATENYGIFRSWYQRAGRTLGIKEGFGVKKQEVKSNFIFVGQDQFTDDAARQRCISVRIPIHNREMETSYKWIEGNKYDLSAVGYHWIQESFQTNTKKMIEDIDALDKELRESGCETRTSKNYASIGVFGIELAHQYFPKFDFKKYLLSIAKNDTIQQQGDDMVLQFFNTVEGLQAVENAKITSNHIGRDGNKLYIWFAEVFRLVQQEARGAAREEFSKNAILEAIREEKYFVGEDRQPLGTDHVRRRVISLNLDEAPEVIKNIGDFYGNH